MSGAELGVDNVEELARFCCGLGPTKRLATAWRNVAGPCEECRNSSLPLVMSSRLAHPEAPAQEEGLLDTLFGSTYNKGAPLMARRPRKRVSDCVAIFSRTLTCVQSGTSEFSWGP